MKVAKDTIRAVLEDPSEQDKSIGESSTGKGEGSGGHVVAPSDENSMYQEVDPASPRGWVDLSDESVDDKWLHLYVNGSLFYVHKLSNSDRALCKS